MKVFEECELEYRFRKERRRKAPRQMQQIIGDLTHRAVAEDDLDTRESELKAQIASLPAADRLEAERIVRELIENDDKLDTGEVHEQKKDKVLLSCPAPIVGWTLLAKPDETGLVDSDRKPLVTIVQTVENGAAVVADQVLQIVEKKTAYVLRKKHKDQVFFAGMVAQIGKALGHEGPIKLVIRLLRSKTEHVFWYSRAATERNLHRVGAVIRRIENAIAKDDFKATTGLHCLNCPYRFDCPAFAAWSKAQEKPAQNTQGKPGFVRHPYLRRRVRPHGN